MFLAILTMVSVSAIEYFTEMKMKDTNFKSNVHLHTGLHVKTHNRNHIAKRRNAVNAKFNINY